MVCTQIINDFFLLAALFGFLVAFKMKYFENLDLEETFSLMTFVLQNLMDLTIELTMLMPTKDSSSEVCLLEIICLILEMYVIQIKGLICQRKWMGIV